MIILLDTSSPVCRLWLVDGRQQSSFEWQADRQLAKGLLGFIASKLQLSGHDLSDISGIGVLRGPGSFTGLRIGLTVANTLADSLAVPIVGEVGRDWVARALERLHSGQNQQIVMPLYDREANITLPQK